MRRRFLMVLALVPALLSGCSLLPGGTAGARDGDGAAAGGADGDGTSWIVAAQGSATPAPRPTYPAAAPSATATGGFLPLGTPAATRTPTATCSPNAIDSSRIGGLDVTPGSTSALLSWYDDGADDLVEFRLYAISQDLKVGSQRDVGYVKVQPRMPCGQMTATIGNLDRRTTYVFSVDAVVVRRSGDGTHAATVARSGPVTTG